jgi:hypothetical protein
MHLEIPVTPQEQPNPHAFGDTSNAHSQVTAAATSKVWTVLNTGVMGSNIIRGMDSCFYSVSVLSCVGSGLAKGWSPAQGVLATVYD